MIDSLRLLIIDVYYLFKNNEIATGNDAWMFDGFGQETKKNARAVGTEDPFMCLTDTAARASLVRNPGQMRSQLQWLDEALVPEAGTLPATSKGCLLLRVNHIPFHTGISYLVLCR